MSGYMIRSYLLMSKLFHELLMILLASRYFLLRNNQTLSSSQWFIAISHVLQSCKLTAFSTFKWPSSLMSMYILLLVSHHLEKKPILRGQSVYSCLVQTSKEGMTYSSQNMRENPFRMGSCPKVLLMQSWGKHGTFRYTQWKLPFWTLFLF